MNDREVLKSEGSAPETTGIDTNKSNFMLPQTEGKIFLAAERGHTETEGFRSYHTFQFAAYRAPHKQPLSALRVLNDETLANGHSYSFPVHPCTLLLLVPLVGGLIISAKDKAEEFVQAGQAFLLFQQAAGTLHLSNPYENELVNYLQFHLTWPLLPAPEPLHSFSLTEKNSLHSIVPSMAAGSFYLHVAAGRFDGRQEAVYHTASPENRALVFVLQGAFEAGNRLLESRDALVLWGTKTIEWEALSNDAILLLLECNS